MKKKQYEVLICTLDQVEERDGILNINWEEDNFTITSESLLIR